MENLVDALREFKEKKVLVIGDILLDQSVMGNIDRLNPENPAVHLIRVKNVEYNLGGAGNVARNITSLGALCYLFGQIGRDTNGEVLRELCGKEKIRTYFVDSGRETIVKQRLFSDGQYISRVDYGEDGICPLSQQAEKDLKSRIVSEISSHDLLIFSDYNKGIFKGNLAERIIKESNSARILKLVDPKPANINAFIGCDVIRPNKKEAEEITGLKYNGSNLKEIASIMAKKTQSRFIAITCGSEGAVAYNTQRNYLALIPTKRVVELGDATGAGDTFAAVLGLGISSGLDFENSVLLANYAATTVVRKIGTAVTSVEEIKKELEEE